MPSRRYEPTGSATTSSKWPRPWGSLAHSSAVWIVTVALTGLLGEPDELGEQLAPPNELESNCPTEPQVLLGVLSEVAHAVPELRRRLAVTEVSADGSDPFAGGFPPGAL
jgi:hypothetical protein